MSWSTQKTLVVGASWIVGAAVAITAIAVPTTIYENAHDAQHAKIVKACVSSGQSWIGGNCVSGKVVKP